MQATQTHSWREKSIPMGLNGDKRTSYGSLIHNCQSEISEKAEKSACGYCRCPICQDFTLQPLYTFRQKSMCGGLREEEETKLQVERVEAPSWLVCYCDWHSWARQGCGKVCPGGLYTWVLPGPANSRKCNERGECGKEEAKLSRIFCRARA